MSKLVLITSLLFLISTHLNAQNWGWVNTINSGQGGITFSNLGTDSNGNIYHSGHYGGTITLGNLTLTTPVQTSFLAKYTPSGNVIWAKNIGMPKCQVMAMTTDKNGNCYLTGGFYDSLTAGSNTLYSIGHSDIFVLKTDSAGEVLWAQRGGSPFSPRSSNQPTDYGFSIDADSSGNCYAGGLVYVEPGGHASFGSFTTPLNNSLQFLILPYAIKFDQIGQVQWVNLIDSSSESIPQLAVTPTGDCFVTGNFRDTITFNNGTSLIGLGSTNIYHVRYNSSGDVVWANQYTNQYQNSWACPSSSAIAVNTQNESFIMGSFYDSVQFNTTTLHSTPFGNETFLAKFNADGSLAWARAFAGTGVSWGTDILELDDQSNAYLAFSLHGQLTFGQQTITPIGSANPIILKYDSSGNEIWAKAASGPGTNLVLGFTLDPTFTKCYLSGNISGSLNFNNQTVSGNSFFHFLAELNMLVSATPVSVITPELSVYPNPSKDQQLHLQLPASCLEAKITLTNMQGQLVHQVTLTSPNTTTLNLPRLLAGTYILSVQTPEQVFRQKVVLQ